MYASGIAAIGAPDRGCRGSGGAEPEAQSRRVVEKPSTSLGLDVHEVTIAVAIADSGSRGAAHSFGRVENTHLR